MPPLTVYYDKNDYKLLEILDDLLDRGMDRSQFKTLLVPYLKPHGIKELAADRGLRIAYAIMHLLESLKSDQASDRIKALMVLRDETLTAARGSMRNNRARVLVQIGKELIRAKGDRQRQLELAHDFRRAAAGKVGFLRGQLRKYHLLEMPEAWNQVAFDHRVHDANSKGRKSATHLLMDAWVKGIRYLTVVYYDCMDPDVARELFAAAWILRISVRIGIEYKARLGDRFVKMVWGPTGLQDTNDIEGFFRMEGVRRLMSLGREVQAYKTEYVRAVIDEFNERHRLAMSREFGVLPPLVSHDEVAGFIGSGQPSLVHLGNYIHQVCLPLFAQRVEALREEYAIADYDARAAIAMQVESLDALDADTITARYLQPGANPAIPDPDIPLPDGGPELLSLCPATLTARLREACHSSSVTLILSGLELEDVLDILYSCQGRITHFEIFNTKRSTESQIRRGRQLKTLLRAVNEQNAVVLKRLVRDCLDRLGCRERVQDASRLERLKPLLERFDQLLEYYKHSPLKTSVGSGSTGRSTRTHGMGFAVLETLPLRAQLEVRRCRADERIPVEGRVVKSEESEFPGPEKGLRGAIKLVCCRLPWVRFLMCRRRAKWGIHGYRVAESDGGNVVALGGMAHEGNRLHLYGEGEIRPHRPSAGHLNTGLKNCCKVVTGFIPAFLTFYLTKDWWLLACFGGVIWFAITGLRNIIQSVLGGGGFRRSPHLSWNTYIDWERTADSLLYTGFSVPVLDWLCKSMVLDAALGINTATSPFLLYSIMALTNGIYILTHNLFRGLPPEAAVGNLFRSVISIPLAMALSVGVGHVLTMAGVADVTGTLQLWAAVISKFASDCVAGVIEGCADRRSNIAMRRWDYSEKCRQVFEMFSRLEIEYPTTNMLKTLQVPEAFLRLSEQSAQSHVPEVIANALDLLYVWAYKPRAREALRQVMADMSREEVIIFLASQQILTEERCVATLLVDGLVGRNFSKALSFYLLRYRSYLAEVEEMARYSGAE